MRAYKMTNSPYKYMKPILLKVIPITNSKNGYEIYLATHYDHQKIAGQHHMLSKSITRKEIETYITSEIFISQIHESINTGWRVIILHPRSFITLVKGE